MHHLHSRQGHRVTYTIDIHPKSTESLVVIYLLCIVAFRQFVHMQFLHLISMLNNFERSMFNSSTTSEKRLYRRSRNSNTARVPSESQLRHSACSGGVTTQTQRVLGGQGARTHCTCISTQRVPNGQVVAAQPGPCGTPGVGGNGGNGEGNGGNGWLPADSQTGRPRRWRHCLGGRQSWPPQNELPPGKSPPP